MGLGVAFNPLVNAVDSSLMVGFGSNIPTLFVGPSDGAGTFGNVGIGLNGAGTQEPTQVLDVNGNARFRTIPDSTVHSLILGYDPDTTDANLDDRVLTKLDFPDTDTLFLAGNGTWQAVNASDCDWNIVNNGQDLAMGYTVGNPLACVPGNVGIGIQPSANSRFDVEYIASAFNDIRHAVNVNMTGGSFFNYGSRVTLVDAGPPHALENYGFHSYTKGANKNYAGNFNRIAASNTSSNFGLYAFADGGTWNNQNYAYFGRAQGGGIAYGIYATANSGLANWAGYFQGRVKITGYLDVAGTTYNSDEALKRIFSQSKMHLKI